MKYAPWWWAVVDIIFFAALSIYLSLIVSILIDAFTSKHNVDTITTEIAISIAITTFAIGIVQEFKRMENIIIRIDRLDNLGSHFHQFFTKLELLSMYEALKVAPDAFWDEYSKLAETEIDENTNRKFRDMAASYQYADTRNMNRTALIVSTAALIIALIVALIEQADILHNLLLGLL